MHDSHPSTSSKVYIVCMNPFCPKQKQRCMDSKKLQTHPQECCHHYFPAELIIKTNWKLIENYPSDPLGQTVKQKYRKISSNSFIHSTVLELKSKLEKSIDQLQKRLNQLYPIMELDEYYTSVYGLEKVAQSLRMKNDPSYISNLINNNFMRPKYNALLLLNESYDEVRNTVQNLYNQLNQQMDVILKKHKSYQKIERTKTVKQMRRIKYDMLKSRFIASSEIQFTNGQIQFPKVKNISSFLPWIYGEKYFHEGVHEMKISSVRFPLVQNAGFSVIEQCDSDTYPYSTYKSLFNKEGKGFKLIKGDQIETHIAQSTTIVLRMELDQTAPRAVIFDSEMKSVYQCALKPNTNYRMAVYGSGWAIILLQLS